MSLKPLHFLDFFLPNRLKADEGDSTTFWIFSCISSFCASSFFSHAPSILATSSSISHGLWGKNERCKQHGDRGWLFKYTMHLLSLYHNRAKPRSGVIRCPFWVERWRAAELCLTHGEAIVIGFFGHSVFYLLNSVFFQLNFFAQLGL